MQVNLKEMPRRIPKTVFFFFFFYNSITEVRIGVSIRVSVSDSCRVEVRVFD